MKLKTPFIIFIFVIACMLQACSGSGDVRRDQLALRSKNEAGARQARLQEALSMLAIQNTPGREADYVIGPGDVLDIRVYHSPDIGGAVSVSSQGLIELPLAGKISAAGMTPVQLEKVIAQKLLVYIKRPFVSVMVKNYRSQRVSVLGAVRFPRVYVIRGQKNLVDMLAAAGGLTGQAGQTCTIMRTAGGGRNKKTKTMIVDLDELLDKGDLALDVPVRSGDIINVQRAGTVYIDGSVRKPGAYQLRQDTTLVKAIAMAEGLSKDAYRSRIKIYREVRGGSNVDNGSGPAKREVLTVDYNAIIKGKQKDVKLCGNDIILVPTSGAKAVFYGILNTLHGYINFGPEGVGLP